MSRKIEHIAFCLYLAAVFVFGFAGVGAGRILLALSLACLAAHLVGLRRAPRIPAVAWLAFAYTVWVSLAVIWGPESGVFFDTFHKHLPWLQIPLAFMLLTSHERLEKSLCALAAGSAVLALRVLYESIATVLLSLREGLIIDWSGAYIRIWLHRELDGSDIIGRLVAQGGMQDGQRLTVGLIACVLCVVLMLRQKKFPYAMAGAAVLTLAALFLTFKRGAWGAAVVIAFLGLLRLLFSVPRMQVPARRRRAQAGLLLLAVLLVIHFITAAGGPSAIHQRMVERTDYLNNYGGRTCMWLQITPALVREFPFGIGFKTLTNERMRSIAPQVERQQNHVHSNIFQALIDGGWIGLALLLAWAAFAFRDALAFLHKARGTPPERSCAFALLMMLTALAFMGIFEYQLGSGQIVLLYGMLMGAAAAGNARHSVV